MVIINDKKYNYVINNKLVREFMFLNGKIFVIIFFKC